MSTNNPSITAADIKADVETRLGDTTLDTTDYLPWISYAYQKLYRAIVKSGQKAKEYYFGDSTTFNLTAGTAEYDLDTNIPRFGGFIKVEIKYGGTGDDWIRAKELSSVSDWDVQNNVSTSYRSKEQALYYKIGANLGFIPTPPATDSNTPQAKVFYVKRPYQISAGTDVIDIPYRYQYPINDYVHAKALIAENESYGESLAIERNFERQLLDITEQVEDEFNEHSGSSIRIGSASKLRANPLRKL